MKENKKMLINGTLFLFEVIGIFVLVQAIIYAAGNWSVLSIALLLLSITLILFIAAFISARIKDKRKMNKSSSGLITGA